MKVDLPFSNYGESRIDADDQVINNLYPNSDKGWRQYPSAVKVAGTALGEPRYVSSYAYIYTGFHWALGSFQKILGFRDDGAIDTLDWDGPPATLYKPSSYSVSGTDTVYTKALGAGFTWPVISTVITDAGTRIYHMDRLADVYEFSCSQFNPGSASYTGQKNTSLPSSFAQTFRRYDTRGYVGLDKTAVTVDLYTGNNFSSLSLAQSVDISGDLDAIYSMSFGDDNFPGNKLFVTGEVGGEYCVAEYDTDISSSGAGTLDLTLLGVWYHEDDVNAQADQVFFLDTGASTDKVYLSNNTTDLWYEFDKVDAYWPSLFSGGAAGLRGMQEMAGTGYLVYDIGLYSFGSDYLSTKLGTIEGTDRVIMETDGVQLVITTGAKVYRYTVAAGLEEVIDPALDSTANSSAYLDLAFYLDQPNGQFISSANNDATNYSTDDIAEAESFGDDTVRCFAHNQRLYVFGESSTEVWFTSGVGRPPIEREQVIERGILNKHCVTSIDNNIYFLDQFRRPNVMSGLEYKPIYAPGIAEKWSTYDNVDDAYVISYSYNQQNFVEFHFPSVGTVVSGSIYRGHCWSYCETSQSWSQRQRGAAPNDTKWWALGYMQLFGETILLDSTTAPPYGSAYLKLSSDNEFTNFGPGITTLTTAPFTSSTFGVPGQKIILKDIRVSVEPKSTTFPNPNWTDVVISLSKDGGAFGQSRTIRAYNNRRQVLESKNWGELTEGIVKVASTGSTNLNIIGISADIEYSEV